MLDPSGYQVATALVVLSLVASATTGVCAWHPLAPIRLTNAAAQLPCGSGETQGEGMPLHFTCQWKNDSLIGSVGFVE
jgi:hypothetical protein